jgi:restriction endonuclease S subunit
MRSEIVKKQIRMRVTGAAQPQLPIRTLVEFEIPVPKYLETQKQLVSKVRALEAETRFLAAVYQQKLDALDALSTSLLHQAFSGNL